MNIKLEEHKVPKQTRFATVMRSLNQHKVFIENEAKEMVHCGYIGVTHFLPLSGFPSELCAEVAEQAGKILNRTIGTVEPPPSITKINELAEQQEESDE